MTDHVLADVIEPSVLRARRAARAARDLADTLADARRAAIGAERSALAALREAAERTADRADRMQELEAQLAAARAEGAALAADLAAERRVREALERRVAAEAAERSVLPERLESARAADAELVELRAERDRLAAALHEAGAPAGASTLRSPARSAAAAGPPGAWTPRSPAEATAAAGPPGGPPAPPSLKALAAAQVAAAAAARQVEDAAAQEKAAGDVTRVAAELDRAAAALRALRPERDGRAGDRPDAALPALPAPASSAAGMVAAPSRAVAASVRAAAGPPGPSLREALVRFARSNPAAAGILLAGLLPAQGAIVSADLEYDLTIRGTGTYAITLGSGMARIRPLAVSRPRQSAELHLTADPLALAELLLGSRRRVGRLNRELRFRGRRQALDRLEPIVRADLSLTEAVRAGARIDPVVGLLALAVAVPPAWTRGHRFTVEHVLEPGGSRRVFLQARDGAGLRAATSSPSRPDATVRFTSDGFHALLRGEAPAPALRSHVRGDRGAVAVLRGWAERVVGR